MRDIAFLMILLVLWPLCLRKPWIGVMTWVWLSLNVPQLQTFGFMYGKSVAAVTAALTLVGILFSREPKRLPVAPPVAFLIAFTVWMCITYFFSLVPTSENFAQLDKVLKINFFTLVTIYVLHTRRQVDWLIAVAALSVAFFGIKGGIFTITTGGAFRVRGAGGFLHGNNEIGLGLVMTVPLLYYLTAVVSNKWLKRALWVSMGLTAIAALGTHSRGALLAIAAMGFAMIVRSPHPFRLLIPVIAGGILMLTFMPDSWWERMETIRDFREDESAMGRINAWIVAWNVATNHFFGGGFTIEFPSIFERYAPNPDFIAVAHSNYFQVLGHHGFIGLFLWLAIWFTTWLQTRWVARHSPDPKDLLLARMIQVSLIGYMVGGAFLNMAYFDGPYYLMAALVIVRYKVLNGQPKAAVAAAGWSTAPSPSHPIRPTASPGQMPR